VNVSGGLLIWFGGWDGTVTAPAGLGRGWGGCCWCDAPAAGLIRQAVHTRIAATIRKIKNSPPLLLTILGLRPSPQNTS